MIYGEVMPETPPTPAGRRRCAIVGLGSRHELYRDAILRTHTASAQLVGLCDVNAGRLELSRERCRRHGGEAPAGYLAADFDRMLREQRPDTVIVTTVDASHDDYIVRAMEAGCDVITEKPMTTDAPRCRRILDACRRTGRSCQVTFNYRYSPPRSHVRELLMSGEIGDVLSVDFHWLLNTDHGADYFRRWHAHRENSGGLLVHKATHHFDLVNWWLGAMPVSVAATGKREFYTPAMARRLGLSGPHGRCLDCSEGGTCGFRLDLRANPRLRSLYLEQEHHDGYRRDGCVFRPEIDIEDTMNALVTYDTGATLSYSLNAFNAWEGYTIAFNGTKGRLEHSVVESTGVSGAAGETGAPGKDDVRIRIIPLRDAAREITPWSAEGDHGGGDRLMLQDIFDPGTTHDPLRRRADHRAGACSVLVGVAANRSIATGSSVRIADLTGTLERPDFAPNPTRADRVPMPARVA